MTVGKSHGTGSDLLPSGLGLDSPPESEAVKLGDLEALQYAALGSKKLEAGTLRLYAAPITDGVATIACVVPPAAASAPSPTTAIASQPRSSWRAADTRSDRTRATRGSWTTRSERLNKLDEGQSGHAAQGGHRGQPRPWRRDSLQTAYRRAAASLRNATDNPQVSGANDAIVSRPDQPGRRLRPARDRARAENEAA